MAKTTQSAAAVAAATAAAHNHTGENMATNLGDGADMFVVLMREFGQRLNVEYPQAIVGGASETAWKTCMSSVLGLFPTSKLHRLMRQSKMNEWMNK